MRFTGLGISPTPGSQGWFSGAATDCTNWVNYAFAPACWAYSIDAWRQMAQFHEPSPPPTVGAPTGSVLTTPPASGEQAQQTIDDILAQQIRDWQEQNQAEMNAQPEVAMTCDNGSAYKDSNGVWQCPSGPTSWQTIALIAAAIIAGGLFLGAKTR